MKKETERTTMTRINSGIDVKKLTDEHLLAEHREIKRLPYCLKEAIRSGSIRKIPEKFTLGRGHILFFLDKMKYAQERYLKLNQECKRRRFEVTDYSENFNIFLHDPTLQIYYNDYNPGKVDKEIIKDRIKEKIHRSKKKVWHYMRRRITKDDATRLLEEQL